MAQRWDHSSREWLQRRGESIAPSTVTSGGSSASAQAAQPVEFEVDDILEYNPHRGFLVSWRGYGVADNTWEPIEVVEPLAAFERFMGELKDHIRRARDARNCKRKLNELEGSGSDAEDDSDTKDYDREENSLASTGTSDEDANKCAMVLLGMQ